MEKTTEKTTGRNKEKDKQSRQQKERANSTTHNQTRQTKQKKGGERGASVEKPGTSLARQFKHPELKIERSNQIPRTLRLRSNG